MARTIISMSIRDDIKELIEQRAKRENISLSRYIENILIGHLAENEDIDSSIYPMMLFHRDSDKKNRKRKTSKAEDNQAGQSLGKAGAQPGTED